VTFAVAANSGTAVAARVRGLCKVFGATVAVEDVDLDIPDGAVLGMLGPNGSGKTTLIRLLLGLTRPTAGTAELLGHPMPTGAAVVLPHVGALVEGPGFHPFLSGRENLRRVAAAEPLLPTRAIPAAVDAALERVGLGNAADRRFRGYSLGMKQRLGLAGALLLPRRLVILDEPANGLDPQGIRWLRDFLRGFAAKGNAVLVSSHVLTEMAQLADEAIVISRGRLVRQAPIHELTKDSRELVVVTPEAGRLAAALHERGIAVQTNAEGELHVTGADAARVGMIAFETGVPVLGLVEKESSLEDAFLELTEEDAR